MKITLPKPFMKAYGDTVVLKEVEQEEKTAGGIIIVKQQTGDPLEKPEAKQMVVCAVGPKDPHGLKVGDLVLVNPYVDSGSTYKGIFYHIASAMDIKAGLPDDAKTGSKGKRVSRKKAAVSKAKGAFL
jgi:co-chaperonin GroES (HSP10)